MAVLSFWSYRAVMSAMSTRSGPNTASITSSSLLFGRRKITTRDGDRSDPHFVVRNPPSPGAGIRILAKPIVGREVDDQMRSQRTASARPGRMMNRP